MLVAAARSLLGNPVNPDSPAMRYYYRCFAVDRRPIEWLMSHPYVRVPKSGVVPDAKPVTVRRPLVPLYHCTTTVPLLYHCTGPRGADPLYHCTTVQDRAVLTH